jgi:hypothetical protein
MQQPRDAAVSEVRPGLWSSTTTWMGRAGRLEDRPASEQAVAQQIENEAPP